MRFELARGFVSQGGVQIILVVLNFNPTLKFVREMERAFPLCEPETFFFDGAHNSLSIGVALGVVVVNACSMPRILQFCINDSEVGWHPLSDIR